MRDAIDERRRRCGEERSKLGTRESSNISFGFTGGWVERNATARFRSIQE